MSIEHLPTSSIPTIESNTTINKEESDIDFLFVDNKSTQVTSELIELEFEKLDSILRQETELVDNIQNYGEILKLERIIGEKLDPISKTRLYRARWVKLDESSDCYLTEAEILSFPNGVKALNQYKIRLGIKPEDFKFNEDFKRHEINVDTEIDKETDKTQTSPKSHVNQCRPKQAVDTNSTMKNTETPLKSKTSKSMKKQPSNSTPKRKKPEPSASNRRVYSAGIEERSTVQRLEEQFEAWLQEIKQEFHEEDITQTPKKKQRKSQPNRKRSESYQSSPTIDSFQFVDNFDNNYKVTPQRKKQNSTEISSRTNSASVTSHDSQLRGLSKPDNAEFLNSINENFELFESIDMREELKLLALKYPERAGKYRSSKTRNPNNIANFVLVDKTKPNSVASTVPLSRTPSPTPPKYIPKTYVTLHLNNELQLEWIDSRILHYYETDTLLPNRKWVTDLELLQNGY